MRKVGHTSEFLFGIYWRTLKNVKNRTFEKMEKIAENIIILHMMISYMRYSSWDTEWDRILCHFSPFFALLTPSPLATQKTCATKNTIIWCMLTHIWSARIDLIFCHFRSIFALLSHYWPQKLKFGKNVKKHLEKLSFYTGVPLIKIICTLDMMYDSWDMKFNRELLCHLGPFFAFYPFNSLQNENIY